MANKEDEDRKKRKGIGPLPDMKEAGIGLDLGDKEDRETMEGFIRKVVHSHQVIITALKLLNMKDTLYLLQNSDIVFFFKKREARLREIIRDLKKDRKVALIIPDG